MLSKSAAAEEASLLWSEDETDDEEFDGDDATGSKDDPVKNHHAEPDPRRELPEVRVVDGVTRRLVT